VVSLPWRNWLRWSAFRLAEDAMIDENRKGDVSHSILLRDYIRNIKPTDTLPKSALNPVLLGLFGEVGSIMTTAKKLHREKNAYSAYRNAVEEEFGDTFWYFTTLCSRLNIGVDDILSETASAESYRKAVASSDLRDGAISHDSSVEKFPTPDETLLKLGESAAALLNIDQPGEQNRKLLQDFADQYLRVLQAAQLNFTQVLSTNISKT
tara:strand:+ start:174 stop:800 length:627 start_codon:yes stop_codon:yes gene_type:complete